MSDLPPISIRRYSAAADEGWVFDTWLRSYRGFARCDSDLYFPGHRAAIRSLLGTPSVTVLLAFPESHTYPGIGWVCYEPQVLHYAYTGKLYRRSAVMTRLLSEAGLHDHPELRISHETADWDDVNRMSSNLKGRDIRYDPYAFFRSRPSHPEPDPCD